MRFPSPCSTPWAPFGLNAEPTCGQSVELRPRPQRADNAERLKPGPSPRPGFSFFRSNALTV